MITRPTSLLYNQDNSLQHPQNVTDRRGQTRGDTVTLTTWM